MGTAAPPPLSDSDDKCHCVAAMGQLPISWVRKLGPREVKGLTSGHTDRKQRVRSESRTTEQLHRLDWGSHLPPLGPMPGGRGTELLFCLSETQFTHPSSGINSTDL